VHDEGLRGNLSSQEKVAVLTQVMADQRDVLTKYLKKPATEIPQIFVPYKETMDVYELGLQVADDVTLVWVDDNYGYMKRLSGPDERKRSGGAGVYYHFSYLGAPHDYLWLNTTPPVLMYEELMKAYRTGADRYWLVNVGDIKPAELGMQTFFDLAWNVEQFDYASINRHQSQFLASTFGAVYEPLFQEILDEYYRLAWSRKPEFMGWEREWDAPRYKELANTDFSFQHYNDAQQRLADYQRISDKVDNVLKALPEASRPAFYELMAYPVMGAYQMNRKFLMAQLNNEQVKANNLSNANWAAAQAKAAYDSINSLTLHYNTLLDGKWDGMMALAPGWCAKYQNMPHVTISEGVGSTPVDLVPQADKNKREGCTVIDLKRMKNKVSQHGHTLRIIEGIGYDGYALQLGEATEQTVDPTNLNGTRVDYEFAGVTADSVTVHVYSVPFWALHKGKSTRYGLTVDGQPVVVSQSDHKEYSDAWKDRVMQNSVQTVATFPVDKARPTHTFTLTCGDPGMIIQRVVIDWGGLKKTYVGPSVGSFMLFSQPKKTPPLTPRWMLEQVVWEDSLNTQEAAVRLVDLYLKHQMPVGSIIIDSPWSMAYNDFTWNTARYPNATEMIRDFNKKHVKVILWLTGCINLQSKDVPVQKHPAFDEVIEKKYVVNDGKVSKWWKGEGLHLDFTNKEAVKWWNAQLDKVTIEGVYGFKVDQGEIYFGDTVHTSIGALSNVDFRPYYYNSLYQYATNKKSEGGIIGRPFSHQGGIEASVEQLSLGWCGDFEGSWSGLKLQINNIYKSAELGYGAPACEVGGFWNARSSKKELIRYAQFGAMTASMINGGENGAFTNHLPWYHGEEATFCYRQAAWLHSQLVPYLFSSLVDVHQTGGSIIKNTDDAQESHTVGDFLFTKAITSANDAVSFKLPQDGRWMDFWTKEVIAGGTTIQQVYPLNRFPLYIKTGAIIPMNINNGFSGIGNADLTGKQTIWIVPDQGKSAYNYNRPLGDGVDYETINISYDGQKKVLTVDGSQELPYAFILSNCTKPVRVNNADAWEYNEETNELWIFKKGDAFSIKINDGI
jgi:alpha-D-xyloside xylohydrolase